MKTDTTISKEREQSLWRRLDETRDQGPLGFLSIVRYLRYKGEQLSLSELVYIQQRVGDRGGPFVVPPSVAQFFGHLINLRESKIVLDPAGSFGLLGAWLAETLTVQRIDIVTPLCEAKDLIAPLNLRSVTLHVGTWSDTKARLAPDYDAIVASGPVGLKQESRTYETEDGPVELRDDASCLLIADVSKHLRPDGFLALVMAPAFKWNPSGRSVRRNLERLGLHLSALLTFRPGIFAETSIAFDLAIIERTKHDALFVAEVPEDAQAQAQLVSRLWKRKEGSTPSLGWLVSERLFYGLPALEAKERAKQLAKSKGLEDIPFNRAVKAIRSPRREGTDMIRYEERPDAVYLPEMAMTAATTRQDELPERLKSYFQLIVNPEVVFPEYLAELLNTPLGHAMREAVKIGSTIPRINESLLRESVLYLAPIADQKRAIDAVSAIQRLRSELSELESKIWERPRQVGNVIEALGRVNHKERFEEWIETLPFPLASILRSYHALDRTDKEKYERLLHFFEALTEFCAAVHLSAFKTSAVHWQSQREVIANVMRDQHFSLKKPTFGFWCAVAGLLAGALRSMLNGKSEERAVAYSLYTTASSIPLEMLSSKELVGLVQRANSFRNRWTGHGGAVTPADAAERHELLNRDLEKLREVVGPKFLQYQLIEPREAEILPGPVFRCRVRRVMGSNPQLEHKTVEVTTPAKTGALYLHNPGHDKVLELIPLVQVRDTPQPASYFYNRREKMELHLVSYHFADQSEVSGANAALIDLIDEFKPNDAQAEEPEA